MIDGIVQQIRLGRRQIRQIAESCSHQADLIPPNWNNNMRWHAGHLVYVPRALILGLSKQPLGVPEEYRQWFGRGTSPSGWGPGVPPLDELLGELDHTIEVVADWSRGRENELFPEPYQTALGIMLTKPANAWTLIQMHDGIHLGLMMALRRALGCSVAV